MAGQSGIKWNEANIQRLNRLVKQIQRAARTKAFKEATDIYVDTKTSVIKANIKTQEDLRDYERIAQSLSAKNLKTHRTRQGTVYTTAGQRITDAYTRIINRSRARKAGELGLDVNKAISSGAPLTETEKIFVPKSKVKPQQYKTQQYYSNVQQSAYKQVQAGYFDKRLNQYKINLIAAINNIEENGLTKEQADYLAGLVTQLDPNEVFTLTHNNPLFDFDYVYSSVRASLKFQAIIMQMMKSDYDIDFGKSVPQTPDFNYEV